MAPTFLCVLHPSILWPPFDATSFLVVVFLLTNEPRNGNVGENQKALLNIKDLE